MQHRAPLRDGRQRPTMGSQGRARHHRSNTDWMNPVKTRSLLERQVAARERLGSPQNMWLATASDGNGPHLIPVSYWWDGSLIITATPENSRTMKNIRTQPRVRLSIGATADVLMIDAVGKAVPVVELAEAALERVSDMRSQVRMAQRVTAAR